MSLRNLFSCLLQPFSQLHSHRAIRRLTLHLFSLLVVFTVRGCNHLGLGSGHAGVYLIHFLALQPDLIIEELDFNQRLGRLHGELGDSRRFKIRLD